MLEGSHVDDPLAMTVREVAVFLNVDEKTVYRLAKRGELPRFKVAGTWRFGKGDIDAWDIDAWIERQLSTTPATKREKSKR
jgi:excisionase family DNA binding protein